MRTTLSLSLSSLSIKHPIKREKEDMNTKIIGCGEVTLVLSHGFGGSQEVWDKVVPRLSQRHRVMVFDWSFSGAVDRSAVSFDASKYCSLAAYSDDLISLLDQMKMKGVVFVGHSMAGMIGCIASVKRPDLFTHLVLVGASPRYLNSEEYKGGLEMGDVKKILSGIESDFPAFAEGLATNAMGPNGDPASTDKFVRGFQKMSPEIALVVARTIFLSDERDVLEKVVVPCTIVQGTDDVVVPVSVGRYMQSKMKGETSIEVFESDGHFPQLTAPERLFDAIERASMPKKLSV